MCLKPCIIFTNTWISTFQTEGCLLDVVVPESCYRLSLHPLSLKRFHSPNPWIWLVHSSKHSVGYHYSNRTPSFIARHSWLPLWGLEHLSLMNIRGHWQQIDGLGPSRGFSVLLRPQQSFKFFLLHMDSLELLLPGGRPWAIPMILKAWPGRHLRTCFKRLTLTPTTARRLLMSLRRSTRGIWRWLSIITEL